MAWDHSLHEREFGEIVEIVCSRFESEDTDEGKVFSIGGAAISSVIAHVSEDAYKKISQFETKRCHRIVAGGCLYRKDEYGDRYGLVFEHVVPNRVVREVLQKYWNERKGCGQKMDRAYVGKILKKLCVALITKAENETLNNCYKDRMPNEDWLGDDGDVFGRYVKSGLGGIWHVFQSDGESCTSLVPSTVMSAQQSCEAKSFGCAGDAGLPKVSARGRQAARDYLKTNPKRDEFLKVFKSVVYIDESSAKKNNAMPIPDGDDWVKNTIDNIDRMVFRGKGGAKDLESILKRLKID